MRGSACVLRVWLPLTLGKGQLGTVAGTIDGQHGDGRRRALPLVLYSIVPQLRQATRLLTYSRSLLV